jgi:hypothetical protein
MIQRSGWTEEGSSVAEVGGGRRAAAAQEAPEGLPVWAKALLVVAAVMQVAWIVALCWGVYELVGL